MNINADKAKGQAGASLFEVLMFIVVSALVIFGVISLGSKVFSTNDDTAVVRQVVEFATVIKSTHAGQNNFTGTPATPASLHQALITSNYVPHGIQVSGTNFTNEYNGAVNVNGIGSNYSIQFADIPDASCLKIVAKTNQDWVSVRINGNAPEVVMPVPVTTALAQCTAGSAGNVITWIGR